MLRCLERGAPRLHGGRPRAAHVMFACSSYFSHCDSYSITPETNIMVFRLSFSSILLLYYFVFYYFVGLGFLYCWTSCCTCPGRAWRGCAGPSGPFFLYQLYVLFVYAIYIMFLVFVSSSFYRFFFECFISFRVLRPLHAGGQVLLGLAARAARAAWGWQFTINTINYYRYLINYY